MITKVDYNWMFCTDKDYGEEMSTYEVGKENVVSIREHLPLYAYDPYYCFVTFLDGCQVRITNINKVTSDNLGV